MSEPDLPVTPQPRDQTAEQERDPWVAAEQTLMGDGQLGSEILDAGAEGTNPEGSAGIDRPRPQSRTDLSRMH